MKNYLFNIAVSLDQLFNALAGGDPDETISSRTWRNRPTGTMRKFIDWLFSWHEDDHCKKAYEKELQKCQFAGEVFK